MSHTKNIIKLAKKFEKNFKLSFASEFPEFKSFDTLPEERVKSILNQASIKLVEKAAEKIINDYVQIGAGKDDIRKAYDKFIFPENAASFFSLSGVTPEELSEVKKYKGIDAWYNLNKQDLEMALDDRVHEIIG